MPSPPQRESRGRVEGERCAGWSQVGREARTLPTLPGLTPPPREPPYRRNGWLATPPSLPLRQVALHEAALQHGGLPEEQVPPVLEQDLVTRLLRLRAGARVKAMGLGLGMGSGPG